jgi:hypothetical protein
MRLNNKILAAVMILIMQPIFETIRHYIEKLSDGDGNLWIVGIILVVVFLLVLIPVAIIRGVKKRKARKLTEKKERLRNKI